MSQKLEYLVREVLEEAKVSIEQGRFVGAGMLEAILEFEGEISNDLIEETKQTIIDNDEVVG